MSKTNDFDGCGCCVDEEFGLAQYEDECHSAPQVSGSNLADFAYNSEQCVQPESQVLYPVISVVHGGTTYFYYPEVVYVPVIVYYYVPVAFAYQDPTGYVNPCFVDPYLNGAAEIGYDYACNDPPKDNGIYDGGAGGKVSPAISTFFSYSENPEKLLDAPVINDRENPSSRQTIEVYSCYVVYGGDCKEGGGDAPVSSRNKLPQKDLKKIFDMKEYYFNDCLRIPRKEPRYEEEWEKYYLYQMLSSLKLSILKRYMREYYNKKKKKVYKRACKGRRLKRKQLKELEWRPHQLDSIREEEEPEQDSAEMEVGKTLRKGILKNPQKGLGSPPRKRGGPYRVRFKEGALRDKNKDSESVAMRGPYRVTLEEGAVKKKVIFEKDVMYKKDLESESRKMSDPHRVRLQEGAISRNDLCCESPKTGDPCRVKVGNIEVRYAPDRYRVLCLENRQRKRFPSIRKFFARMFGKNPP